MAKINLKLVAATTVLLLTLAGLACAAENGAEKNRAELKAASEAFEAALQKGPQEIKIAGQAVLHLPAGYGYVSTPQSKRLLEALGNRIGNEHQGMIVSTTDNADWFVAVSFSKSGYVKDDDAKDWNADKLLKQITEGTEETNKIRKEKGIPEMEIVGWIEPPAYDAGSHRLVWSLASKDKGSASADQGVNYNTLALGRDGYISMNMVTGKDSIEALKPTAKTLLAALDYDAGKKYADFNASTDKVAAYGLAALVAGVAAKKLGFFAIIAAFAAKFAKVIAVAAIAMFGGIFNKFRKKKDEPAPAALPDNSDSTPPAA
jgi:uncharacterized membrane-anchored protein